MSGDPLDHDVRHSAGSRSPAVASPVTSSAPTTPPAASSPRMAVQSPIRRYDSTLSNGQPYRRGSSKEFETFDELLRAAGYKETRVISPEMERQEILEQEAEERRQHQRSFVESYGPLTGRVAHFLSTYLAPAKASNSFMEPTSPAHGLSESPTNDRPAFSFDALPHDNRYPRRYSADHPKALSLDTSPSSSSAHVAATPKQREPAPQVITSPLTASTNTIRPIVPLPSRSSRTRPQLRTTASSPHLRSLCADSAASCITPATAALQQAQVRQSRTCQLPNGRSRLPLPDAWLDSFAKTVLGSRAASHINATRRHSPRKSSSLANRKNIAGGSKNSNSGGRKGGSLPGRNSNVNLRVGGRSSNRAADRLLARSPSSGSAIVSTSKTRVVCRSSSTGRHNYGRGGYGSDSSLGGTRTPILCPAREGDPLWGDAGSSPRVPPLPATYAALSAQIPSVRVTRTKTIMSNRNIVTDDEWEYEYDDDEDEPHLSNLVAPISRQRSIQSLRACLDKHAQGTAALYLNPQGRPIREQLPNPLFRNASYGQYIHRKSSGFEEDEDEVDLRGRVGTPWSQGSKKREGRRGRVVWGWDEDDA